MNRTETCPVCSATFAWKEPDNWNASGALPCPNGCAHRFTTHIRLPVSVTGTALPSGAYSIGHSGGGAKPPPADGRPRQNRAQRRRERGR